MIKELNGNPNAHSSQKMFENLAFNIVIRERGFSREEGAEFSENQVFQRKQYEQIGFICHYHPSSAQFEPGVYTSPLLSYLQLHKSHRSVFNSKIWISAPTNLISSLSMHQSTVI